jgi:hypothetical protein
MLAVPFRQVFFVVGAKWHGGVLRGVYKSCGTGWATGFSQYNLFFKKAAAAAPEGSYRDGRREWAAAGKYFSCKACIL